jgi:hypothetical protein
METIFGFRWPVPSVFDIAIMVFIILLFVFIMFIIYFSLIKKETKNQAFQLFLFRVKNLGLTTYKIKILHAIVDSLSLGNPIKLLNRPLLFETAINRYHNYLTKHRESIDSMKLIYEEIIEIYETLYRPSLYREELKHIVDIDKGQLFRLIIDDRYVLIGKLSEIKDYVRIKICTKHRKKFKLRNIRSAGVFFFRPGDAEYEFSSRIISIDKRYIEISIPPKFTRIKPIRLPDIDVEIKGMLKPVQKEDLDGKQPEEHELECYVLKLNRDEASINVQRPLDFKKEIFLEFEIDGFLIKIKSVILSEKRLRASSSYYYTLKFTEMSDAAREVINKFLTYELKLSQMPVAE